jgi:pimeloyl-ACP methyl ester carboxylesterase
MTSSNRSLAWSRVGTGAPIVFLHGYGANRSHWTPWLPALARRYECLTVDLPGFGEAPAPADGDYSPAGMAEAVVDWIEQLDLEGCTIVGHSMGGGIALLVALALLDRTSARGRSRLTALVSVAGAAYPQREPPFVHLARLRWVAGLGFALLPKRWLVRMAMRQIVVQGDAVTPERVEAYAGPMRNAARRRAFLDCARRIVPTDLDAFTARIPEIDVPALCLWGRQDPVVPLSIGQRLAYDLPRGRLQVLEACGHQVVEERPDESLDVVRAFLDTHVNQPDDGPPGTKGSPSPGTG